MRKLLLLLAAAAATVSVKAQTVSTFDSLALSKSDTFYVNTANSMTDQGFNDGLAHFDYYYDTSYGGYWTAGWLYSNMTDSVTSGYTNMYSAKAGKGYNGSAQYAVANGDAMIRLINQGLGQPVSGLYITNSTYTYNSMRDGDGFAKKFTAADSDWFKVTIKGYSGGQLTTDSVNFMLADFTKADSTQDYIQKDWAWVDLSSLGAVDSITFHLSSSDNGQYGMNTPGFFCIDNFTSSYIYPNGVPSVMANLAKVYPNPATDKLFVELANTTSVNQVNVIDMAGRVILSQPVAGDKVILNTANLAAGTYYLQLSGDAVHAGTRFVKQ
ncbi:DUF4465 domain-containing protein [Taibaiella soli]|uniref:DUF4465 domain-containing protein n=1 Tax=Taibaiella soli TaxID=1649169 RepID=A0A2W2B4A3_9BACT|nr:DUF4465 domain-containing protein [Taibaiella soli]PZF71089.1 DUF4465 domain-containing protein [Taibaiella soli]